MIPKVAKIRLASSSQLYDLGVLSLCRTLVRGQKNGDTGKNAILIRRTGVGEVAIT
jgi:hypothetical protein